MPWGAAIAAAGTIGGAAISAGAAGSAGKQSASQLAAAQSIDNQRYGQINQDTASNITQGQNATTALSKLLGTYSGGYNSDGDQSAAVLAADPSLAGKSNNSAAWQAEVSKLQGQQTTAAQADPSYGSLLTNFSSKDLPTNDGYQFQLQQGTQALQRSQAANGGLISGAAAKAMDNYTQGLASTEYQNAYNNFNTNKQNTYNDLSGLSGIGQNATGTLANAGVGYASANSTNAANQASNTIGSSSAQTNSVTSALSNLTGQNSSLYGYLNSSGTGLNGTGKNSSGLNQLTGDPYASDY